ncbi:serine hydrolase [Aerococcaceae bacterium zg-BR9]|uniref:serine hydrolase n=1 Tax=Aerococcaceae bacterium zg-1292 TaxID=2774330 RepID=UPI004063B793|nr:serine hydrolase [Aerococcaceae bacterium zg-BR9]
MLRIILVLIMLLGVCDSHEATVDNYLRTRVSTTVSATSPVNAKAIALFDTHFNSLQGDHQLYFRQISDKAVPVLYNNQSARSASIIKLYILAVLFDQVEKEVVDLEAVYQLKETDIVGGTGGIQQQPIGSSYTLYELAKEMIIASDNTATNIIIEQLGGVQAVATKIHQLGFKRTHLRRKMLDMQALAKGIDNETMVSDVGELLSLMYQGNLVSKKASQAMMTILESQQDRDKLFAKIPAGVRVYNKTGTFAEYGVLADAGIIRYQNKAYVVAVISNNGEMAQQQRAMQELGQAIGEQIVNN